MDKEERLYNGMIAIANQLSTMNASLLSIAKRENGEARLKQYLKENLKFETKEFRDYTEVLLLLDEEVITKIPIREQKDSVY